tara:strand:+ start:329 stop:463 length:135 start_codon:yes stop_codon:yes gene_type:complete
MHENLSLILKNGISQGLDQSVVGKTNSAIWGFCPQKWDRIPNLH